MAIKQPALILERERRKKKKESEVTPKVNKPTKEVVKNNKGTTHINRTTISTKPGAQNTTQNRVLTNKERLTSKPTISNVNKDIRTVKTSKNKSLPKKSIQTVDVYERGGNYYYKDGKKEKQVDTKFIQNALNNNKSGVIGRYNSKGKLVETDERGNVKALEKNVFKKAGRVAKGAYLGAKKGFAGIADAAMQETRNDLQKGEKIDSYGDLAKNEIKALIHAMNPTLGRNAANQEAGKNIRKIWKDEDKTLWQKIVGTGLETINAGTVGDIQGLKESVRGIGAVDHSADEKVKKVQEKIDEPINKQLEKFEQESNKYDKTTNQIAKLSNIVGNMIPGVATSVVTKNPTLGLATMGLSAKGQSTERAEMAGADLDTATKMGTAGGWTEVGTELLTGGVPIFGKGALDDIFGNLINSKIKSKGANFVTKKILGTVGEEFEEVLSDLAGVMIDRGTIDPNAKYTLDDFLETAKDTFGSTFILNLLTGGYGGRAYRSNIADMQNYKAQQANEVAQRVESGEIDVQEGNALLEQVKDGTYTQNRNLEQIAMQESQRLQEAAQQGIISQEEYTQELQTLTNAVNQTREEINTPKELQRSQNISEQNYEGLNQKEYNEIQRRYKDLIETIGFEEDLELQGIDLESPSDMIGHLKQIKDIYEGDEGFLEQARNESTEVYKTTKSQYDKINRLINRFEGKINQQQNVETNQVANNQQEITQEQTREQLPTNTEDKIQNFRNSVANENVEDSEGFYKAAEKIIQDKDYNVILDSSITNEKGESVNAMISNEDGITIRINPKSERAGEILLAHEITHGIETKEMSDLIVDYASKNAEFNTALEDLKKTYGTEDVTPEVVADISGQLLGNQDFINSLSTEKPNLFKRIHDKIIEIANKITGNSKEKRFIKDLKVKWEKAYRESNIQSAQQNLKEGAKYSQNAEITDNKGRPINIKMQNYMQDSQATNDKGELVTLYHTTTDMIKQFNIFDPANKYDPSEYKFGKYNVTYLTDGEEMSESYSMYEPRKADTRRLHNIKEAEEYLENTSLRLVDIENTNQAIKNHFKNNENRYFLVSGDLTTFGEYKTEEELLRDVIPTAQQVMRGDSNYKYEVYANITKPFIIDADGNNWNKVAREINEESKKVVDSLTESQKKELYELANESLDKWQEWHMSDDYMEYKKYDDIYKNLSSNEQENLILLSMKDNFTAKDYEDVYKEYGKEFGMKDPNSKIELNPYGEVKMQRNYKDFVAEWCRLENESAKYNEKYSYFMSQANKKYNNQLRNIGVEKLFDIAKYDFKDWAIEDTLSKDLETNDVVRKVIEMNENGENYDGVIIKNTKDYGVRGGNEPHDLYVVFNSNQIKAVDNLDPTSDPDIRYSQKADKWQQWLNENFPSRGTTTVLKDKINNNKNNIPATKNENTITIKNDNLKGIPKDKIKSEDTGVSINGKQVQMQIPIDSKPNKLGQYVPKDGFTQKELKSGKLGDSKFYKNVTERADFIRDEVREKIKNDDNIKHYRKVTNEESMQEAFNDLNTRGTEAIADFFNNDKELTSKDTAMGLLLIEQSQENGDYDFSTQVLRKMRSNATKTGQTMQMYNYYARLTPEGMYRWCGDQLLRAEEIFEKNKTKKWIEANKKRWQLNAEETNFIKSQMERVQELNKMDDNDITTIEIGKKGKTQEVTVERAKQIEIAKIQAMIENKIPPEKGKAINAWMRISMLGNLKTIGTRNPMGNIALRPINDVGDIFASAADFAISKVTGVRTKGTFNAKAQVKGFVKGGSETVQDARLGINTRNSKGNRFEIGEGKAFNEQHTGAARILNPASKLGNYFDSKVSFLLDLGDRPFYEASYAQSLENQMKLNGITKLEDVTDSMKKIAEKEALERTYQDDNNYTKSVIAIRDAMNNFNIKGYGLGDVLIPFAKTPANLTKAIVDYSPAGFVNAITKGKNLKNSIQNGQFTPEMQHAFVNQLGKATAGTILYAIGAALSKAGITTGGDDEDKDLADFMKNTLGIQPYSIKVGDKSYTYDWAQPVASGLAVPADIRRGIQDAKEGEVDLQYIIHNAFASGGKVLLEQSFLQGIKDVLGGYGDPLDNLMSEIEGLPARAVPTLFQQIVTYLDGTKRMSYGNKGTQNVIAQAQAKTPWAKDLPVYRNSLGKEVKMYGGKNNFFNVFINPANYSQGNATETAKEIYRVYQATNDKTVLPRLVDNKTKNEDGKNLTNQQKSDFLKISGDIIEENVGKMMNEKKYQDMSDDEKAEKIKAIVGYSYNKAREEITGHKLSGAHKKAEQASESGYSIADYFLNKTKQEKKETTEERNRYMEMKKKGIDGKTFDEFKAFALSARADKTKNGGYVPGSKKQKIINYIQKLPLSAKQKQALWEDYQNNTGSFQYYK